jgi:hypothetical protein
LTIRLTNTKAFKIKRRQIQREVSPLAVRHPRYSKEEFAQRGDALYEDQIRSQVEEGNHGKIVAICLGQHFVNGIETGVFEIADDTMAATRQLYERLPDAQPWVVRIDYRAVHRFGARSLKDAL